MAWIMLRAFIIYSFHNLLFFKNPLGKARMGRIGTFGPFWVYRYHSLGSRARGEKTVPQVRTRHIC